MKTFLFKTQQPLAQPITEVFEFFSNAHNLAIITPPWLHFEVLTPAPIDMSPGTRIDYRLKLSAGFRSVGRVKSQRGIPLIALRMNNAADLTDSGGIRIPLMRQKTGYSSRMSLNTQFGAVDLWINYSCVRI